MEKFLFLLAIVFAFLAISSRHKLHKSLPEEQESADDASISQGLSAADSNPQSLGYALNKVVNRPPPPMMHAPEPPAPTVAPPESDELNNLIKAIQAANDQSMAALEKALSLTSKPGDLNLRLTVLQAALSLQGDNRQMREMALHEATSLVVSGDLGTDNPSPEAVTQRDLERNLVTTAYKDYLQANQDPDSALSDTLQILNYQTDSWTRKQILFDCANKFPQLKDRLGE